VVVVHEGRTNFSELQAELAAGRQGRLVHYAFDLLWRNGDLRKLPQIERKQLLLDLLGENDIELPVLFSEHLVGDGQKMFEHAAKLNWEGIISKRADAPYRSERTEAGLKIKAVQKGKFPVVGFVKDPAGVAALYLGKQEGKDLVYTGKVGTGWSRTVSSQIRKQLDNVVSPKSKLTKPVKKPKATWVEPKFYADVEYRDITSEGLCGLAHLKDCLGNRSGERTISPFVRRRHLHRIWFIAEQALQLRSAAQTRHRHHSLPAVQTTCHSVHGDLPP
jgi:bifunctional non-homologous end joining protein LigD